MNDREPTSSRAVHAGPSCAAARASPSKYWVTPPPTLKPRPTGRFFSTGTTTTGTGRSSGTTTYSFSGAGAGGTTTTGGAGGGSTTTGAGASGGSTTTGAVEVSSWA
ncbi:MAG: hypothetical protein IPJ65_23660 [Archangiaceae bacterium]|nr:hypothetical protein [Archangiaceae bacterium]